MPDAVSTSSPSPQEQLEQLQAELASRQSIVHFAHSGVATMAALIVGGASAKLFHDSLRTPILAWLAALVSLGLLAYAVVHYRRGRRCMHEEARRYETLLELRRALKLDDPSALLPG